MELCLAQRPQARDGDGPSVLLPAGRRWVPIRLGPQGLRVLVLGQRPLLSPPPGLPVTLS